MIPLAVWAAAFGAYRAYDAWVVAGSRAPRDVLTRRLVGASLLGGAAIAYGAGSGEPCGLAAGDPSALLWTAMLAPPAALVVATAARSPRVRAEYPEIRPERWTPGLLAASAATWALYLAGYEALFRGAALFPLAEAWGAVPAVAVSTALYVVAHLHKDRVELLTCVPMGFVFGGLALATGAIWAPLAVHVVIALAGEWGALRAGSAKILA